MPLKLNSSGGGSVTLDVPSTGSTFTATLPAVTGNVVTTGDTGSVSATMLASNSVITAKITDANVTPAKLSQPLTVMSSVAASGQTSIPFTSIPSWVKRITVMFSEVTHSTGSTNIIVQLGDSGGVETTGYVATGLVATNGATSTSASSTAGFIIRSQTTTPLFSGIMVIANLSGNLWVSSHSGKNTASTAPFGGGSKTLSDVLTQINITTSNGTDTFTAGSFNVLYEG